jgi:Protein of unknown function DUF45
VIVHELAHLVVPRHDARFWKLVRRYRRAELARGFLIARGLDPNLDGQPEGAVHHPDATDHHGAARAGNGSSRRKLSPNGQRLAAPRLPGF